jgi:DNA-binding MarR family transcriptional regulator
MVNGHELAMALRGAYLTLHRKADAALGPRGVTADQFVLLATLAKGDAVTQRDLARRTTSDPNTIRAMLLLLEARGLVARRRHPGDARAWTVTLTAKGRQACKSVWVAGEPVRQEMLAALAPGEAETLLGLLGKITRAMGYANEGSDKAEVAS